MRRLIALILILFFIPIKAYNDQESSFWDDEYPKRFFDVPSIQEQTNYAFHNVQHDNSVPFRQLFQKNRQIDSVFIPFDDEKQRKPGIKEQINVLIPNKNEQKKILEIVDSKNKSLVEKISDLTKTLANKSNGLEQSEILHELVSNERARENVMYELKDSLNFEYKIIADKLVGIQKNMTLSENEKLEIQKKVLENIAEKAKEAFKSFEAFFQRSRRNRRQLINDPEIWNYRSSFYAKPGSENFPMIPPNPIPQIPTVSPATNGNYADMLTKNKFLMPTPLEIRSQSFPPSGFFPQEPTRPPNFDFYPGQFHFEPPKMTTAPPPPTFGMDLSESVNTMSKAFEDRNQLFQKEKELLNRGQKVLETAKTRVWNDGSQFIQRTEQTIGKTFKNNQFLNNMPKIDNAVPRIQAENIGGILPIQQSAIGQFDTHIDRYDTTGNEKINRVILPDNFMQTVESKAAIVPSIRMESMATLDQDYRYMSKSGRPSPFGSNTGFSSGHIVGSFGPTFEPLPVLGPIPTTFAPRSMGQDEAHKIVQNGGFYPVIEGANTKFGPQTGPIGTHDFGGGFYGSVAAVKSGKPDNTRILTSENVGKTEQEPNSVVLTKSGPSDSLEFERAPSTTTTTTLTPEVTPYTTYPDYRQILFPVPLNQAKADPRPASGTIRRQDMFGGGTNQYREDNGRLSEYIEKDVNNQKQWPSSLDVDNKRMDGYINPAIKYGPVVTLENQPKPPYNGTSRASRPQGYMEGDDLSKSDVIGGIPWGRSDPEFTTPLPWNEETTTIVAVPKIDIDSRLSFPANQNAKPSNKEIVWNRISETAMKLPEEGQIRPYFGPEEITRSRYININPPPNNLKNGFKNRFVKIDLPNTSTIS